jgi:hypothetical protein
VTPELTFAAHSGGVPTGARSRVGGIGRVMFGPDLPELPYRKVIIPFAQFATCPINGSRQPNLQGLAT